MIELRDLIDAHPEIDELTWEQGNVLPSAFLRPAVVRFAWAMEERLRANDHKGGWSDMHIEEIQWRVWEEYEELAGAIDRYCIELSDEARSAVRHEAADTANFLLMLFDRLDAEVTWEDRVW